jgi:hypothetical protein
MRYHEILVMGGQSSGVRFNSEIAVLYAFAGKGPINLDNIEESFDSSMLDNPQATLKEIKRFLIPSYNEKLFSSWAKIGKLYKDKIAQHSGKLPTKLAWVGGANAGPVADVEFLDHPSTGISIKDTGGITLANLTPKALGIDPVKGVDVFANYAKDEFDEMKHKIFSDLLDISERTPNEAITPLNPKYSITYEPSSKQFTCTGKKPISATRDKILSLVERNAPWQRVFGDFFQSTYKERKEYAAPLYKKLATIFEQVIENKLSEDGAIARILKFEDKPYYYANPKKLFYVPDFNTATDLRLKRIKYAMPEGTSQKFLADIGHKDSDDFATIDIYIRYANGMFEANPTVRVQSLKNPQYLAWEEIF